MADQSKIEWTDSTFNPWIGCTKVSPGCDNCYAAAQDKFRKWTPAGWGAGQPRKRTSADNWDKPPKWNERGFRACKSCGWRGEKSACEGFDGLDCPACGGMVQNARRRVFCASLADVFDNEVPVAWRSDLLDLIANTPNLDWLLLTKRIGNARHMIHEAVRSEFLDNWYLAGMPNVWLGATIVDQEEADRDITKLLATPARVRFLSMEPLLGPVKLAADFLSPVPFYCDDRDAGIDWVIVGGESGPGARPMHPDWARGLRDQCAAAGVPFLFKQHGEWSPLGPEGAHDCAVDLAGRVAEPLHRERFPADADSNDGWTRMYRVGKKAAGRLLDGRTHDEFPEVRRHA